MPKIKWMGATGLALSCLLASSAALAWNIKCTVDEFTDEEHCGIYTDHMNDASWTLIIGRTDDGTRLVMAFSKVGETTLYTDSELFFRVDEQDAVNLADVGVMPSMSRNAATAILPHDVARALVEQMKSGQEMRIRVSTNDGRLTATGISLMGFTDTWNEFSAKGQVPWE